MTHELECPYADEPDRPQDEGLCYCAALRAAYQRGLDAGDARSYHAGYAQGRNDQARSRAYAEAVYGPYTPRVLRENERIINGEVYVQHGKGENP